MFNELDTTVIVLHSGIMAPRQRLNVRAGLRKETTTHQRGDLVSRGQGRLTARVGRRKAVVAPAHKDARILWAVLARGRRFNAHFASVKPKGSAVTVPATGA